MNRFKGWAMFFSALAVAVAAAIGVGILWPSGGGERPQEGLLPGQGIALAAPPAQGVPAFPSDQAGFSAYLNVGAAIQDMEDLVTVSDNVCGEFPATFSQNHMLCVISRPYFSAPLFLYADVEGWLVAYLDDGIPASAAAIWSGDGSNPVFESATGRLDGVIQQGVEAVGEDYEALRGNTGYYDWEFQQATVLTTIVKTSDAAEGGGYFFSLPTNAFTLHGASVTAFGTFGARVHLDGTERVRVGNTGGGNSRGERHVGTNVVGAGVLHEVANESGIGSAIYLLWSGGQ